MATEHLPVVVIGGGQAGLAISWHLVREGIGHAVLERETITHTWADARWDSFCLVTPNWQCRLPGYAYAGADPEGFMVRSEILEWLAGCVLRPAGPRAHRGASRARDARRLRGADR
jgi:putative flavoprotein involved in K+ transport